MRILVLGAGLQGSACAYDLLQSEEVERVLLADLEPRLPLYLEPSRGDPRLLVQRVDARDEAAVALAMRGTDICLNALPYYFNLGVTRHALEAGVHYADLGGNTEIVFRQLELDATARERGVAAVPDCGLAPGMGNILAVAGMGELDQTETVKILVGGLPQHPRPPLNYHIVYSLEGVLDYYTSRPWVVRDGRAQQVDALSEIEAVDFGEELGELEAFHTAGGLSVLPWQYEGRVRRMEYKTLRYPGHAVIVRAIRDLGLLDLEPVEVDGQRVVPRRVFVACAEPRLRRPRDRDLVALRVEVKGRRGARARRVRFQLLDYFDEATGISAMERGTGFSLSVTGQLLAGGRVSPGVHTPDACIPPDVYMEELSRRGLTIRRFDEDLADGG